MGTVGRGMQNSSLGRTGGRARGEKELSGKSREATEVLNTVQNDEVGIGSVHMHSG